MSLSSMSELFSDEPEENKKIVRGEVAIHDKVFVMGNSVYQISNMSHLSIHDLSSTKPIPKSVWYLGGAFLFVLLSHSAIGGLLATVLGLALLSAVVYIVSNYLKDKDISKYALVLYLNSGSLLTIASDSDLFLKQIAVGLLKVMNHEEARNMVFNLDNRKIFDNISDSVVNFGNVEGDILNYVKKS